MEFILRNERPEDYRAVELLTYEAFNSIDLPGRTHCDEHLLAHKLRSSPSFVKALDYVALAGNELIGNIMYTLSQVDDGTTSHQTLTFGPLSVLPAYQSRGVGAALVNKTIELARSLGHSAILIMGHPDYYPRFGFKNAKEYGITTLDGENFDAFMALELYPGALSGVKGKYSYDPVFEIDSSELPAFNKALGLPID